MKRKITYISIILVSIGFAAYGFMDRAPEPKQSASCCVNYADIALFNPNFLDDDTVEVNRPSYYSVQSRYMNQVTQTALRGANWIDDLIPDYPSNWITHYISVNISSVRNGEEIIAMSTSNELSKEQKDLINSLNPNADIAVQIRYKAINAATGHIEPLEMNVWMTLVPEKQAEFVGGYDALLSYLENKGMALIGKDVLNRLRPSSVIFVINEAGKVEEATMSTTTGSALIDKTLIGLVNNMPKWKPAEDVNGKTVSQEFQLAVGMPGC